MKKYHSQLQKILTRFISFFIRYFWRVDDFFLQNFNFLYKIGFKEGNILYQALSRLRDDFYRAVYTIAYDRFGLREITLIDVEGNKVHINPNDRTISLHLLVNGVWEKYKTELFKSMIKQGMVVIDIGANIGFYTLIAGKLAGSKGRVYAFEPEPNNYNLLCKNIKENNYTNIFPIQKAILDKRDKSKLWLARKKAVNYSLAKDNVLTVLKNRVLEKDDFIEVETISLDGFFENTVKNYKVDIIKVDIEGAEGLMVDGAEKILKNNNLKIFMEFWPDGLRNFGSDPLHLLQKLESYGFKTKLINEKRFTLEPIEINEFYREIRPGAGFDLIFEK